MARRRRREAKVIRKVIPKIFPCPKCGIQAVSVIEDKVSESVRVICGNCGLATDLDYVKNMGNVDYFNKFVDKYHNGEIS
jgi:transcription elongation factor Elf1